jgi:hypothetical protein
MKEVAVQIAIEKIRAGRHLTHWLYRRLAFSASWLDASSLGMTKEKSMTRKGLV